MLENITKRLQGVVLGLIVVMLSSIFILQFGGPQAQGCSGDGGTKWAAKVYGETILEGDFRAAYNLFDGPRYPAELARQNKMKEMVLDGLVERSLLARQARALGYRVTEEDVMKRLVEHGSVYVSAGVDARAPMPSGERRFDFNRDGKFDIENVRSFIRYQLRRSEEEFARAQIEETLAQRMRELIGATVAVSPSEVWDAFVRERERVTLKYISFSPDYYRESLQPTEAEMTAWMTEHAEEVDRQFQLEKHRYTGLEKQVRARHILIEAPESAAEDVKAAARTKAEAALARVRGGEDFATVARELSDDEGSARRGGDLGFNPSGRMVPAFDRAMFALEPGQISELVETQFGFHVIKVEAIRQGDVPEAEAKREVADALYRRARANELAEEAAKQALADLRGGMTLDALEARLNPPAAPVAASPGDAAAAEGETPPPAPPANDNPLAPRVQETRPFGRSDNPIPGPGDSAEVARAAFELNAASPLPDAPMRLGQQWVVFRLESRVDALREDFTDTERARLEGGLLSAKQQEALVAFVRRLRKEAEADGQIRRNEELLRYGDEEMPEESASR